MTHAPASFRGLSRRALIGLIALAGGLAWCCVLARWWWPLALSAALAAAAVVSVRRASVATSAMRPTWRLLGIAAGVQAAGLLAMGLGASRGSVPSAALVGAGGLVAAPFVLTGLLVLPQARDRRGRLQSWVDTVVAGLAFALLAWQLMPPGSARPAPGVDPWLPLAHIVVAAALATVVVWVLSHSRERGVAAAPVLWLVCAAGFAAALASTCAAVALRESGSPSRVIWFVSLQTLALVAAATWRADPDDEPVRTSRWRERVAVLSPVLPLVLAAGGLVTVRGRGVPMSSTVLVLSVAMLVALMVATVVARLDTLDVTRTLEDRVTQRTLELGTEAQWFSALVQNSSDVISVVDAVGVVRYQTPSAMRVLGHDPGLIVGTRITGLLRPADGKALDAALRAAADDPGSVRTLEFRVWHREGRWCDTETTVTSLVHDPGIRGIVLNTRDVSERRRLEEELTRQAFSDALTGLANRSLFRDRVEQALEVAVAGHVAVVFLDLNGFKAVNDSQGHHVGDQLLTIVAQRLLNCVRPGDVVARLGGDEFAVLVTGEQAEAGAVWVADRIRRTLASDFVLDGRGVALGASIGIAVNDDGDETADQLLRNADLAMYRAKAAQRTEFLRFEAAMHDDFLARLRAEEDLRHALGRGELVLHYQPIVDLQTRRPVAVEALVRWMHPERGVVSPLDFIQMAEETGLVEDIGRWALERACEDAMAWQQFAVDDRPFRVAVNVSARQVGAALPRAVRDVLASSGLPPGALTLEMTESVLMDRPDEAAAILSRLKALGVRIAVDDFGTGYSSLSYLARFPVDALKIDRSFVEHVVNQNEQSELARTIVQLGNALRLSTVAEGIETQGQYEAMREMGCTLGQGYLFARPMPFDEVNAHLRRANLANVQQAGPVKAAGRVAPGATATAT